MPENRNALQELASSDFNPWMNRTHDSNLRVVGNEAMGMGGFTIQGL